MASGFMDLREDFILSAAAALRALFMSIANRCVVERLHNLYERYLSLSLSLSLSLGSLRSKMASNLPLLGHCVSVLLITLQSYEAKKLRREVLSAMLAITGVDAAVLSKLIGRDKLTNQKTETADNVSTKENVDWSGYDPAHILSTISMSIGVCECAEMGGAFASFLPGITMALTKLMTSDIKVGSSVTVLALLTWAHYVAMVMDDTVVQPHPLVCNYFKL